MSLESESEETQTPLSAQYCNYARLVSAEKREKEETVGGWF